MEVEFIREAAWSTHKDHIAAIQLLYDHREKSLVYRYAKNEATTRDGSPPGAQTRVEVKKMLHGDADDLHLTCRLLWKVDGG